jgi:hypothetical protein
MNTMAPLAPVNHSKAQRIRSVEMRNPGAKGRTNEEGDGDATGGRAIISRRFPI